jgi:hypothetical protein
MRIHFTLKSIPELGWLPREAQSRIWRLAVRDARPFHRWPTWVPIIAYLAFVALLLILPAPKHPFLIAIWILSMLSWGPAIAFFAVLNLIIPSARPYLRKHVADEFGQPSCWECGYDLSGNATGVCSECGARLTTGNLNS